MTLRVVEDYMYSGIGAKSLSFGGLRLILVARDGGSYGLDAPLAGVPEPLLKSLSTRFLAELLDLRVSDS